MKCIPEELKKKLTKYKIQITPEVEYTPAKLKVAKAPKDKKVYHEPAIID